MDELDERTEKTDLSLKSLGQSAKNAGGIVKNLAVGIAGAAAAISTFVVMTAKNRQELEILARQAKLTTEEFSALSFATKQYGINGEQIADISKDIADKMGEFGTAGTGAFQDFADVVGMTKEEAQVLAIQMQDMSGPQVIGELVRRMEDAGASTNDMTFALESVGNDLSRLLPLFADGGKELKSLEGSFISATAGMKLTQDQAKELEGAARSFDALTASLGASANVIAANLAPAITDFFNEIKSIIPLVTEDLVNFINSFKEIGELRTVREVEGQIGNLNLEIAKIKENLAEGDIFGLSFGEAGEAHLNDRLEQLKELEARLATVKLEAEESGVGSAGGSAPSAGDSAGAELPSAEEILAEVRANNLKLQQEALAESNATALASIEDRFKTETELLQEKLEEELIIAAENDELKLQLRQEFTDNILAIEEKKNEDLKKQEDKLAREKERSDKILLRQEKKDADQKTKIGESFLGAAKSLNSDLLEDNKAVGAGIIVADTAMGVQKAFAQLGVYGAPAAAAIAASGLAQLANLEGASRGGGSTSGPTSIPTDIPEQDQEEILLSQTDTGGANQSVIIRFEGSGDEITEAIAKNMQVLQRNGTIDA